MNFLRMSLKVSSLNSECEKADFFFMGKRLVLGPQNLWEFEISEFHMRMWPNEWNENAKQKTTLAT